MCYGVFSGKCILSFQYELTYQSVSRAIIIFSTLAILPFQKKVSLHNEHLTKPSAVSCTQFFSWA